MSSGWAEGDGVVVRPLEPCHACPACRRGHGHICQNLNFIGIDSPGAFQASWTVPAHTLHRLPDGISMELAALIEPLAVACHDVRLGEVKPGERAVVIGGGPIGTLVALVCRHAGAEVLLAEVNPFRVEFARGLGFETVDPRARDLAGAVEEHSPGGADVLFEVSGTQEGAGVMTELVRTRGRIVVVAIFADPPRIDLFRFFWRELRLCGVRGVRAGGLRRGDSDGSLGKAAARAPDLGAPGARGPAGGLRGDRGGRRADEGSDRHTGSVA